MYPDKCCIVTFSLSGSWPDRKQPGRASTNYSAGSSEHAEDNKPPLCDPPHLCRTPRWEIRGARTHFNPTSTPLCNPPASSRAAPSHPPTLILVSSPAVWPRGLQTHAAPLRKSTTWLITAVLMLKERAEKQWGRKHTRARAGAVSVFLLQFTLAIFETRMEEEGVRSSLQAWTLNRLCKNWQDLRGSQLMLRLSNEKRTVMQHACDYNCMRSAINKEWWINPVRHGFISLESVTHSNRVSGALVKQIQN